MQNSPLVTVICLCYNHEAFVVETLNSVINQSYQNVELIIVDDFSMDNSREVIQKWLANHHGIAFIANENNLGNTKSFNKGLQLAKGSYIIDLAADDVLLPNCIQLQIDAFQNSSFKNLGLVYGNVELITENGDFDSYYFAVNNQKKTIETRKTGDVYVDILSGGNSICSVSSMVKKEVFDALQGYDETLSYEDLDFWIRASRSYEFDYIDEILVQKRILKSGMTNDFFKKNDVRAKKINHSTYLILKKALKLNRTKEENKALLKRIHFGMVLAYKTRNYGLLFRYFWLKLKLKSPF